MLLSCAALAQSTEGGTTAEREGAKRKKTPGPVEGTIMTPEYARLVGRQAYFWAWPMVNLHNRAASLTKLPGPVLVGGAVPGAPLNHLAMLTNYILPEQRFVATPNHDVVYGLAMLALDKEPVVVQVPDFGDRFWIYQLSDQRTDAFGSLGKPWGTEPGFYLIVGPDWRGEKPAGIKAVLRSTTNTGAVVPRMFMDDTAEDRKAIQPVLTKVMVYPLSEFTGEVRTKDWSQLPKVPAPKSSGSGETKWVKPEVFFDQLAQVLDEVPPLPGEESLYAHVRQVLDAAEKDPKLKAELKQVAVAADKELIDPLFQYRNEGVHAGNGWNTVKNGARFGTDYLTRTAAAKANIFVNQPEESMYFLRDADAHGARLDGRHRYTITFPADGLPPVKAFWSLTMYGPTHFFVPNELKRYSLGTKNNDLKKNDDGSLTLYVQADPPSAEKKSNWLPAPRGAFSLVLRAYWLEAAILRGEWAPPQVTRAEQPAARAGQRPPRKQP
jgi:hypothetical protein